MANARSIVAFFTVCLLALAGSARAALEVDAGSRTVDPGTAGQVIDIDISGGDPLNGVNARLQLGDGASGPLMTFVEYQTGTIFEGESLLSDDDDITDGQKFDSSTAIFPPNPVNGAGTLFSVTIDTTSVTTGRYALQLADIDFSGSDLSTELLDENGDPIPGVTLNAGSLAVGSNPIVTWTGATDGVFSTGDGIVGENWDGFAEPQAGDALRFNNAPAATTLTYDLADGRNFHGIAFEDGAASFTINAGAGQSIVIDAGQSIVNNADGTTQTLNLDIASASPMTIDAADGDFIFGGELTSTSDTLTLNAAATRSIRLDGALAGSGDVEKTGDGDLILDGIDATGFTGGIELAAGSLRFVVDQDLNIDQTITGDALVNKTGPAQLTLGGLGGFTGELDADDGSVVLDAELGGDATVDNATFDLNGNNVAGLATVNAGGELTGSGDVGGIDLNGGTVTPGASIGAINVTTDPADFDAASIFNFELAPGSTPASDQIVLTNGGTIADGATFNIALLSGALSDSDSFTLINTTGGTLTVDPAQLNADNTVDDFDFELSVDSNDLLLTAIEAVGLTWDGNTDGDGDDTNFSDPANFADDSGITAGGGLDFEGKNLIFEADGNGMATADDGAGGDGDYDNLGGIEFADGLGVFVLDGGQLSFSPNAEIVNNDTASVNVANTLVADATGLTVNAAAGDILLTSDGGVDLASGGDLTFTGDNVVTAAGVNSGAGGIVKNGTGDAFLSATNTFAGEVIINDGRLFANDGVNNDAVPDNVVVSVNGNGAFWINHDETIANIGSGSDGELYVTGNTTLTFGGDNNDTVFNGVFEDGAPAGNGNVTKTGAGVATLNGDSAAAGSPLSGDFTLGQGGLAIGHDGALGLATLVIDGAGVTLAAVGGDRTLDNPVTVNEDFSVLGDGDTAGPQALTFTGNGGPFSFADAGDDQHTLTIDADAALVVDATVDLTGGDTLTKDGAGLLAFGASNAAVTIDPGTTVQVDSGTLQLNNELALGNADTLDMHGGTVEFNAVDGPDDPGDFNTLITATADFIARAAQSADLAGGLTGAGKLTKQGPADLILSTDNSAGGSGFTGDVQIDEGTVAASAANNLGDGGLIFGGGTFRFDAEFDVDAAVSILPDGGTVNVANAADVVTLQDSADADAEPGIDGGGALTKTGEGKLILTGDNSYDGTTTLAAGILGLGSDTALGDGDLIVQAGVLESTAGDRDVTNPIQVEGDFTLGDGSGADSLTLSGGLTLETDARITVENEQANLINNADLALGEHNLTIDTQTGDGSNPANLQIASNIVGDGKLAKDGPSDLTLSGDNSYGGITELLAGTLIANGSGDNGAIPDGSALILSPDTTFELNADETIGSLSSTGGGTRDVDLAGNTLTITQLAPAPFNGDITGSVTNRGRFGGNFAITGELRSEGGVVAPGNSIDNDPDPEVDGDFILDNDPVTEAPSFYEAEVNGTADESAAASDRMDVINGNTQFADGTSIRVLPETQVIDGEPQIVGDNVADGDVFEIIRSQGGFFRGVDGDATQLAEEDALDFLTIDGSAFPAFAFIPMLDLDGPPAFLLEADLQSIVERLNGTGFVSANRLAAARAIDENPELAGNFSEDLAEAAAEVDEILPRQQLPTPQVNIENVRATAQGFFAYLHGRRMGMPAQALQQDAGTPIGSMLAYNAEEPRMLAAAMQAAEQPAGEDEASTFDIQQAPGGPQQRGGNNRWSAFARGLGVFQDRDSDGNQPGFDADSGGFMAGVDYETDSDLLVGLSAGYLKTDVAIDNGIQQDIDSVRVGPYASWNPGPWFVDAAVTYAHHDFDGDQADYDGFDISAFGRLGYEWRLENNLRITPEVALQYIYLHEDDYTLDGVVTANIDDRNTDSFRSRIGVTLSYPFQHHQVADGNVTLIPEVFLGWEHEFLDEDDIDVSIVSAGSFSQEVADADDDSVVVAGGMSALFNENLSAFVRYEGTFSGDNEVHGVTGGFRLRF